MYDELHRPQFHLSPRHSWMNDPNGLVWYRGEYHLFFQHTPGFMNHAANSWGHAVSADLVHWRELDTAIAPDEYGFIWSGSAVVDTDNSAGFAGGGERALVAVYTTGGFGAPRPNQPGATPCVQAIAYSTDRGRTFRRYSGNPVLGHVRAENRDPKVIRHAATRQWIMALFLDGNDFALYGSPDLKRWRHLCALEVADTGECPDLFELPVDGDPGDTRWVFWGAAGVYRLGSFDGTTFTPETPALRCEMGANGYAAQTWSDVPTEDGRRIQISWMRNGHFPAMPFNGQMSFPVELTLRTTPQGLRLCRQPVKELELLHRRTLRWQEHRLSPGPNRHDLYHVHGPGWQSRIATEYRNLAPDTAWDLFHVEAVIDPAGAAAFGIIIRGHDLRCDIAAASLHLARTHGPGPPRRRRLPAPAAPGGSHLAGAVRRRRPGIRFVLLPARRQRHAAGTVRRGRERAPRLAGNPRTELGLATGGGPYRRMNGPHRPLAGQVAVVAGATRGAGRGIARMLGAVGATVYCTGRSVQGRPATAGRTETIDETSAMVTAEGGRGIAVRTDHTVEPEVERLFERVRADQGRLPPAYLARTAAVIRPALLPAASGVRPRRRTGWPTGKGRRRRAGRRPQS